MKKKAGELVDYYRKFHLDPNQSAEEIVAQLRSMHGKRMKQSEMNPFDYELQAKIEEDLQSFEAAIKIFEKDKSKYDKELAKAYKEGRIIEEVQQVAREFLEELSQLLSLGNYGVLIRRCNEALSNNVKDVRLYHFLAMANYGSDNMRAAFDAITLALTEYPNDFFSLRLGARYSTDVGAYEYAQGYINRMLEVYPENPTATSEQCYLYEQMGKEEMAFKLIDEYLEKNPTDEEFRRACAYDLVALSHSFYIEDSSSGSMIIASQEKYEKCLATCNKANEIYRDNMTESVLQNAKFFGQTKYNDENFRHTLALFLGGIMYGLPGIMLYAEAGGNPASGVLLTLGALLIYSGIRLTQVSFRPYWQINKFFMTGKRERSEQFYIWIGNIFAFFLKWSFKIAMWIFTLYLLLIAFFFAKAEDNRR